MYNLKVNSEGRDDTSPSRASNSRPSSAPRGDKDFRKLLGEKDRDDDEAAGDPKEASLLASLESGLDYERARLTDEKTKKQPSLFDLSKKSISKKSESETSEVAQMASADEMPNESPLALQKNQALKEKASRANSQRGELEGAEEKLAGLSSKEEKIPSRFPQESVDLTYVNPLALNVKAASERGSEDLQKMFPSQKMTVQQLVDALVKSITSIESQGKTDTVVTLKQPPLFAGANVVLTSFETAKGEFNVRFENLSQDAKAFMDMQQNRESLLSSLNEKGYAVHILVATTQVETPKFTETATQQSRDQQQQQQSEDQQQQQRRRSRENQEEA